MHRPTESLPGDRGVDLHDGALPGPRLRWRYTVLDIHADDAQIHHRRVARSLVAHLRSRLHASGAASEGGWRSDEDAAEGVEAALNAREREIDAWLRAPERVSTLTITSRLASGLVLVAGARAARPGTHVTVELTRTGEEQFEVVDAFPTIATPRPRRAQGRPR